MSLDPSSLPPTISVAQAGALLGLGRSGSYEAVRRGELPVLRFGRRMVVPTARAMGPDGGGRDAPQRPGRNTWTSPPSEAAAIVPTAAHGSPERRP